MKWRRAWLALTAVVFLAWLGWLTFLAATATRPVVLSRPQFLVSTLDVIADVAAQPDGRPADRATIRQIHWPRQGRDSLVGTTIRISNLPDCSNWIGQGAYILPLVTDGDSYQVAGLPPSPGFSPTFPPVPPRIYPLNRQTERQLDMMPKRG
jgi:hypothetical protein